ncbi:MAG: glucosamine--fructose-6-phosphate aminotransferase (isomerizing) [Gammaproteobacteria bacterium]|jgi:glucosamine--fructose-6-phosphate aminotransferase (isomerizing)
MCGIVGAIAERNVLPILIEGLRRLEYRGYDSAGVAMIPSNASPSGLSRVRTAGKVADLEHLLLSEPRHSTLGIAHTRWATHGAPNEANAHPHMSNESVAVVHNGIIENHAELRAELANDGYEFTSETDTEVIAHRIHQHLAHGQDLVQAVRSTTAELKGAYALGVISKDEPDRLVAARLGSPLVIGIGIGEHFIASDVAALIPVTQQFLFLEDGDLADVRTGGMIITDLQGAVVTRKVTISELSADAVERGTYRHYMLKEIYEQPKALADTLAGRIADNHVLEQAFGAGAGQAFEKAEAIQIVACGTSYHAGLIARQWFEEIARIPCAVEVASEFRYRTQVVRPNTMIVAISQSGETADTLAALRGAKADGYGPCLGIVNVPESSLVRESDFVLMTRAGPEIGVASTKAFTTQLVALLLLVLALGRRHGLTPDVEREIIEELQRLPEHCRKVLALDAQISRLAESFVDKHHALFLGRGLQYPIAMEGALKLKEISYIHAEAYPAGELKHGPLALIDADMPVIAVAPNDDLLEKLESNLEEVRARGGQLHVFVDAAVDLKVRDTMSKIELPSVGAHVAPIVYTIPLQLLAYHVAVLKGTDIDQPRNLAKSVTVE